METVHCLEKLPNSILNRIIDYLPQQDKLNLLYTNYQFYLNVQPLLYKNLLFTKATELKCPHTFDESLYTIVGVLNSPLATDELNNKIYDARQKILLEALTINTELCKYIENIIIEGDYHNDDYIDEIEDVILSDLLNFLMKNCLNLKRISTFNISNFNCIIPQLTNIQLKSLDQFDKILNSKVKELHFDSLNNNSINMDKFNDTDIISLFNQLDTLTFNSEISQAIILKKLNKIISESNIKHAFTFKNLKLVCYHLFDDPTNQVCSFLKNIDFTKLKKFELVLGCDDMTCNCLNNFIKFLTNQNLNLNSLSLVQKTAHREHNYTEIFDFHITELIKQYPKKENLKTLSIRHAPPNDFNVGDGFEGNYLHRKTLYESIIPLLTGLEKLICPTFLQSISGYEQMISNLLWNGCDCEHCTDYLPIFDQYILRHQYYDEVKSRMTDMISPILFGNVGRVLSSRLEEECDMFLDTIPPLNRYWNFHSSSYQITHMENCHIDKSAFPPIAICVAHFLQEYVDSIGSMIPGLQRCVLSGVFFDRVSSEESSKNWYCSDS
ncbi:hypothetical protein C6P42_004192 [Pichia californica]|nr:hypothetical protein C6P42_004192 [[Candida] californica]